MSRFIAGRMIHLVSTIMFAWVHYHMMRLTMARNYNAPRVIDPLPLQMLCAVIAVMVIGVLIGLSSEAMCIREQAPDLLFFATGGVGIMVSVTALAENDGGVPPGWGIAVITVVTVVVFAAMTVLAVRRYRDAVERIALSSTA